MKKKIVVFFTLIILNFSFEIANSEIFIKAKVNNQIITNIDVKNEKNYLLALNPNLRTKFNGTNIREFNFNIGTPPVCRPSRGPSLRIAASPSFTLGSAAA